MSAALQVTSDQIERLQEHFASFGKSRNKGKDNPRYRTPEKEEAIVRAYKVEGSIRRTCIKAKCSMETVRTVLKARGLR